MLAVLVLLLELLLVPLFLVVVLVSAHGPTSWRDLDNPDTYPKLTVTEVWARINLIVTIVTIVKPAQRGWRVPEQEQLLTVNEAARRMGVSPKIVRTLVDHHQLPSVPVGSRVRIPAAAVQVYVELFDDAADLARQITAAMKPPAQEDPS